MSAWIWLAIAALLLLVGLAVMVVGVAVIARHLMRRPALRQDTPAPALSTRPAANRAASSQSSTPLLSPDALRPAPPQPEDEWVDNVPTAVFKASDYKDIEGLMEEADRYVDGHRRGN